MELSPLPSNFFLLKLVQLTTTTNPSPCAKFDNNSFIINNDVVIENLHHFSFTLEPFSNTCGLL